MTCWVANEWTGANDSFLMRRQTSVYGRRRRWVPGYGHEANLLSKLNSAICSIFTSAYVFYWPKYFPNNELLYPPTFDSRVVLYPTDKEIRDYFSWRQADSECRVVVVVLGSCLTMQPTSTTCTTPVSGHSSTTA